MILKKDKIIFIHIPKTGGSSIEYALLASQGVVLPFENVQLSIFENLLPDQLNTFLVDKKLDKPQHMTAEWYKSQIDDFDSYYKFAVVRHPYDRFLSQYYWQKNLPGGAKLKVDKLKLDILRNREKIHYKHQYKFLYDKDKNLLVDDVFYWEDFSKVQQMLKAKLGKNLIWYELKKSHNKPNCNDFMKANVDIEHFIKYHYAEDFKLLEYNNET